MQLQTFLIRQRGDMDIRSIDWNEIWKQHNPEGRDEERTRIYWDNRASSFATGVEDDFYVNQFLTLIDPCPEWRVLDVGCASGTLAIPLAGRVRQVTGVDISGAMLDGLRAGCEKGGIGNVKTVRASWTDDWQALAIEPHDLVIASRSLIVADLRQAIAKLDRFALRRVCISTPVGDGPQDPAMLGAVGRRRRGGADYIYVYNLLYQMGLQANLQFLTSRGQRTYPDKETLFLRMRDKVGEMLPQEEKALRDYIDHSFVLREGRWQRREPRSIRWAVMWWDKD
jgi:SAM-dependent methyltransferase